jgi:hypothetical protein
MHFAIFFFVLFLLCRDRDHSLSFNVEVFRNSGFTDFGFTRQSANPRPPTHTPFNFFGTLKYYGFRIQTSERKTSTNGKMAKWQNGKWQKWQSGKVAKFTFHFFIGVTFNHDEQTRAPPYRTRVRAALFALDHARRNHHIGRRDKTKPFFITEVVYLYHG